MRGLSVGTGGRSDLATHDGDEQHWRRPVATRQDWRHVFALCTDDGVFEHCRGTTPRTEHGYCTDDVSRALVCALREPDLTAPLGVLVTRCLSFLEGAVRDDGFVNRRSADGVWSPDVDDGDATGRAIWAAGTAAAQVDAEVRTRGRRLFDRAAQFRSRWIRSTAYAVMGACSILDDTAEHGGVRRSAAALLADATGPLTGATVAIERGVASWPWPEARLTYANALLPQALIMVGQRTTDERMMAAGITALRWLVDIETSPQGWLSVTPAGGWAPGDARPAFDQQPIEVSSLADAAWTAWSVTADHGWLDVIRRCAEWLRGHNDCSARVIDPATGGCHDGLTPHGVNLNEGAESTLAAIMTLQLEARRLALSERSSGGSPIVCRNLVRRR